MVNIKLWFNTLIITQALWVIPSYADWNIQVSPYLFMPRADSTLNAPHLPQVDLKTSFPSIYSNIDKAAFLQMLARKNRFILLGDVNYIDLKHKSTVNVLNIPLSAEAKLYYYSISGLVGYRFIPEQLTDFSADVLGGLRYWSVDTKVSINQYGYKYTEDWIEPILALKLRYQFTNNIYWQGYIDSDLSLDRRSWQWYQAISYKITPSWVLSAGYRTQYLKLDSTEIKVKSKTEGPILGISYQF